MKTVICLYKPIGTTPLQLIRQFTKRYPEYEKEKLGYAGRLDPMADGLVLVLVGEENKKRKIYEGVSKEYECDVLFEIATDSYDILGKITDQQKQTSDLSKEVAHVFPSFIGKHSQPYPPYSAQPVHGKPLYYWARENKLNEITIPTKDIEIFNIKLLKMTTIKTDELNSLIHERINNVHGDFRQKEILEMWDNFFKENLNKHFSVIRFRIFCSSGTYIRSFAHNLGKKLQTNALALGITRTKIGNYNLQDGLKLDIL